MIRNVAGIPVRKKSGKIPVRAKVPAPVAVQFPDTSTGSPTAWAGDFGDGSTSADQNPSYTCTTPGTYSVTLIATNVAGSDTETKDAYIVVEKSTAAPEFPAVAFPAAMIVGLPGAVLLVRRTKEH